MQRPIRVYLCDDAADMHVLVSAWFDDHEDLELVGSAHATEEAVRRIRALRPDVVVTDTMQEGREGRFVADLRDASPDSRIVVFSGFAADALPQAAAAADAWVVKGIDEHELVAAIRAAAGRR